VAKPVVKFDRPLRQLVEDMTVLMYSERGVGLAAPQVGRSIRVIVVDPTDGDHGDFLHQMVNPVIERRSGEVTEDEGCLSVPGLSVPVTRSSEILVRYQSPVGETRSLEAKGWTARIIQHEIDHLDGVLMVDYMNPVEASLWAQRLGITPGTH
jgi:peptide deformylase